MYKSILCMAVFFIFICLFLINSNEISANTTLTGVHSPVLYHLPFDDMSFLSDDAVEHTGKKSIEQRKLRIVEGRFGGALYLGAKTVHKNEHNMSWVDLDLVTQFRGIKNSGDNWSEPYIWGSGRIQPMRGSVAFWIDGGLEPDTKLFFQSANAFGRFEKNLLGVSININGQLTGFLVDARYDRHEIVSEQAVSGDSWKHVVFTWDFISGLELYLNGQRAASSSGTDAWWMTQLAGLFHLPAGKHAYDEFYLFDRPLTESEVKDLYRYNKTPQNNAVKINEPEYSKSLLIEKSGISTELNLPVVYPASSDSTLVFEEVWTDEVADGFIPGWWVMDGRYELAWPHPYSVFTIVLGDADYHARKVDIKLPPGKTVNYITVEGNLEGIKVLALEDEEGIFTTTLLEVPKDHGFFYGSCVKAVENKHLRIPFVKGWGTPYGWKGKVNLPLTGNTRLHEVGLFNVYKGKTRLGESLYLSDKPVEPGEHYELAVKSFVLERDAGIISASQRKPSGKGQFINTSVFRRLNIFSDPWEKSGGIASIRLDLYVKTGTEEDVVLIRFRDPAVPSRIWTHAEVRICGFDKKEPGLFSLTLDMTDCALTAGDRLWIDVCSVNGVEILVGDSHKPSRLIVERISLKDACVEYSPKEIIAAHIEYTKMYEAIPSHTLNIQADYRKPVAYGGAFDMVYPTQAVMRVDPDFNTAKYLWDLVGGKYYYTVLQDTSLFRYKDLMVPEDVPSWAVYMRAYMKRRNDIGNWWVGRQNPDGQFAGGWDDDTLHLMSLFDLSLDGNSGVLRAINNIHEGFDETRMFDDGYLHIYPLDRHHVRDFVRLYHQIVLLNLGNVFQTERAIKIGWHHNRPDRTPINYAQGIPFKASNNIIQWFWGFDLPSEPYIGMDEKTLTENLKYWYSYDDSTLIWYATKSYIHTGGPHVQGSRDFHKLFLGGSTGMVNDPHPDLSVSWPNGGGADVARWVEYADDISLKARIYSFDEKERTLTVRLYRLTHGKYSVVCAPDLNNDGIPDGNPPGRVVEIRRFDDIDITLPPCVPLVLHITQLESYGDPGSLPDLALDPEDIRISRNLVTVTVHNIGCAVAKNVKVVLLVNGKPLKSQTIERIDAPVDYVPRFFTVYFDHDTKGAKVESVIDPENMITEILERNNHAVAADYRNTGYFKW